MLLNTVVQVRELFSEPPSLTAPRHLPTLDGVRGLAAFIVFASHCANAGFLPSIFGAGAGKIGVAMFFVLSGFLMAYLYGDSAFSRENVFRYFRQRLARVLPLYFAIVLISIFIPNFDYIWMFPIDTLQSKIVHLIMIHGVNTLWTIPVEVHFYLAFIFIWWMSTSGRALVGLILIQILAVVLVIALLGKTDTYVIWFWAHLFLAGAAIGMIWKRRHAQLSALRTKRSVQAAGWAAFCLLFLALPKIRASIGLPNVPEWADPMIVGAAVIFLLAMLIEVGPASWMKLRIMAWMGSISYGFYLIHYPVIRTIGLYFEPTSPGTGIALTMAAFTVTAILSHLSLKLFEQPAQRIVAEMMGSAGPRTRAKAGAASTSET